MADLISILRAKAVGGEKILSIFLTAGFPSSKLTAPLIIALADAGADLIELGMPFSDPIADGPVIQQSSEIALRNGMTIDGIFDIIGAVRKKSMLPIVLMGYMNPIRAYGLERFLHRCRATGVDGTIIADLPLEESGEYRKIAERETIATIFLAAPTTSDDRLRELDEASSGFLYCVSITGVTGERTAFSNQTTEFLKRVRTQVTKNPYLVGFGISTPAEARAMASISHGVVVGSAFIKALAQSPPGTEITILKTYVAAMRHAIDSGD